jgi:hypothetical protein
MVLISESGDHYGQIIAIFNYGEVTQPLGNQQQSPGQPRAQ